MTCGPRKVGSAKGANRYEKQQLGLRATGEGRCPFDHLNYYHNLLAGLMQVSAGCVVCVIDRLGTQREPTNLCEADQPEALRRIRRVRNPLFSGGLGLCNPPEKVSSGFASSEPVEYAEGLFCVAATHQGPRGLRKRLSEGVGSQSHRPRCYLPQPPGVFSDRTSLRRRKE